MGAFLVLNYDVTDRPGLAAYREAAGPILLGDGRAQVVAISDQTIDLPEGEPAGTDTVILRFDSARQALAVLESADYQAVVGGRYEHTVPRAAFVVPEQSA